MLGAAWILHEEGSKCKLLFFIWRLGGGTCGTLLAGA